MNSPPRKRQRPVGGASARYVTAGTPNRSAARAELQRLFTPTASESFAVVSVRDDGRARSVATALRRSWIRGRDGHGLQADQSRRRIVTGLSRSVRPERRFSRGAMTVDALNRLAARHLGQAPGDYRAACPMCAKGGRDDAVNITVCPDGNVVAHCHRCDENGTARSDRRNGSKRPALRTRAVTPPEEHAALWDPAPNRANPRTSVSNAQAIGAHRIRIAGSLLLIPMRKATGELVGVQKILQNGRQTGQSRRAQEYRSFHLIGEPGDRIVIAEGIRPQRRS